MPEPPSEGLTVIKDFARKFYSSQAWKDTRAAYAKSKGYLCEPCLAKGIYKPCEIIHHKIILTPDNVDDPNVTLAWENLCCICRECHANAHRKNKKRYTIDDNGRVIIH